MLKFGYIFCIAPLPRPAIWRAGVIARAAIWQTTQDNDTAILPLIAPCKVF